MMMSQLSMDLSIEEPLTSYQQDSPANRTPLLDFVKRLVMSVTYGEKSSEYYGRRNQHGSWERTFQDSLLLSEDNSLDVSSMTWSRWGIALGGVVTELRMSEQFTVGTEYSSLPTPIASSSMSDRLDSPYLVGRNKSNLVEVIANTMLPTPRANQAMAVDLQSNYAQNHQHKNLEVVIAKNMLATPRASQDYKPIRPLAPSEANGTHGKTLVADIGRQYLEATGESGTLAPSSTRPVLNPEFVETMMGFPIGWTSIEPNG